MAHVVAFLVWSVAGSTLFSGVGMLLAFVIVTMMGRRPVNAPAGSSATTMIAGNVLGALLGLAWSVWPLAVLVMLLCGVKLWPVQ